MTTTTATTVEDAMTKMAVTTPVRRSVRNGMMRTPPEAPSSTGRKKAAAAARTIRSSTGKRKLQSIDEKSTTPSQQQPAPNLVEPTERNSPIQDHDHDTINAENIHKTAMQLFPQDVKYISQYPVVSARIFAAFVLIVENDQQQQLFEPIRPLLEALVHVEAIALVEDDNNNTATAAAHDKARIKRTHFSGFDGSAVRPPVDREMHLVSKSTCRYHQSDVLQSLMEVKVELQKLSHAALKSVQIMEHFLQKYSSAKQTLNVYNENKNANRSIFNHQRTILKTKQTNPTAKRCKIMMKSSSSSSVPVPNDTSEIANLCAVAIQQHVVDCQDYPAQRVVAAANAFVAEFQVLAERIKQLPPEVMTPLQHQQILMTNWSKSFVSSHLQIEHRLAEQIGQSIRFLLRLYFNRAPPRLSTVNDEYDLIAEKEYSKVSDCVQLVTHDGQDSEAVDDSFLSAIISRALSFIYEFCHGELHHYTATTTTTTATISPTLSSFCVAHSSLPSTKKHRKISRSLLVADVDWELLRRDIQEAAQFLAVVNAAQFLHDLFTAKGVRAEIERFGGWSELEDYATFLWQYELWKICPYDAHLVILNNCDVLLQDLQVLLETLKPHVESCERALKNVQIQYHLCNNNENKKTSKRSKSSTSKPSRELVELSDFFHECWNDTQLFPRVLPAATD
jgi:hypothetical protein